MFFYGRQLRAMGNSGLIPPTFGESLLTYKTPFKGLLFGSLIGYIICLFCFFFPVLNRHLFQLCMLCASLVYFSQFVSFIVFRTLLSNIKREFHSPLGNVGAVVGSAVYLLIVMSIVFFQENYYTVLAFISYTILCSSYYLVLSKRDNSSQKKKKLS